MSTTISPVRLHAPHAVLRRSAGAVVSALLLVLAMGALHAAPANAAGSLLYVSEGGSDSGTCESPATACGSMSYALTQAAPYATIKVSGTIHGYFSIDAAVTISGADAPSSAPAVLEGDLGRVVVVAAATTIEHVRIQHPPGVQGGGVVVSAIGALTMRHTTVAQNSANQHYGGGGILVRGGSLTLVDSVVEGNQAAALGAGIWIEEDRSSFEDGRVRWGSATVIDSTVSGNMIWNPQGGGGFGGGIGVAYGNRLTLLGSTVTENWAVEGGGIFDAGAGTVTIRDSTISGNSATRGGGVMTYSSGTDIVDSTISGNSATMGGGVAARDADIVDSTISGNSATSSGGGIYAFPATWDARVHVLSSTVAGNSAPNGGGVFEDGAEEVAFGASIVAGNQGGNCASSDPDYASGGYNLTDGATASCGMTQPSDRVGDAALAPLLHNGGPTQTMMPSWSSPAIGMIPRDAVITMPSYYAWEPVPVCPGDDQRGYASPQPGSNACTAGAAQPGVAPAQAPAFTSAASAAAVAGTSFTIPITTTGSPRATLSVADGSALPSGVKLIDNGNGTGWLTGRTSTLGAHRFTLRAYNGVDPAATQSFTLSVDTAYVSVDDATVTEGHAGTTTATFMVRRSANAGWSSTVAWSTSPGSAAAGTDFTSATGGITFAPGETAKPVSVTVRGDTVRETDESFGLTLNANGAAVADNRGVATILDDDAATYLSAGDVTVNEGNAGPSSATFAITRSGALSASSSVRVATAAGTATAGSDYTSPAATSVSFAAGENRKTVTVSVAGDIAFEANETFQLRLSAATGAAIADAEATATIVDDDEAGFLSVDDPSVHEGDSGTRTVTFTVHRTRSADGPASVKVATANGTAAGSDYTALQPTTLSFATGESTKPVTVTVAADTAVESHETLVLNLTAATGATIADGRGTALIRNDDRLPSLSVDDVTVTEGNAGTTTASFVLTRSGSTAGTASVRIATADATATAGSDYTSLATTVSFASGEATKRVDVSVSPDLADELNESFMLNLSAPAGVVIADGSGRATIVDDEGTVLPGPESFLAVDDPVVIEANAGTALLTFAVTRSGDLSKPASVTLQTANGTAIAGSDYDALSTTVAFASGEATKLVPVSISNDTAAEPDETFSASLSSPQGAAIADSSGTATIANDDEAYLTVSDPMVVEGGAATTNVVAFTLTRSGSLGGPSSVTVATANGTASAGADYVALPATTVSFAAGEATKTVTVTTSGDSLYEAHESLVLQLSAAVGATIADPAGTATIRNDDDAAFLAVNDVSVNEGAAGTVTAEFIVTRTGNLANASSVTVATTGGSATAGADYTALGATTVSFAPGEATKPVQVTVLGDPTDEPDETIALTLSAVAGAVISDSTAMATIDDDDAPTYISINDLWTVEGSEVGPAGRVGHQVIFTVRRTGPIDVPSSVTYTPVNGTAVDREDYVGGFGSKTLSFAPGEASKELKIIVWSDTIVEPDETFRLVLSAPVGATLSDASGTATIADDD